MRGVITIFLLGICILGYSQKKDKPQDNPGKITGKVIDSTTQQTIEYATISLYVKGNDNPVNGITTNNKGQFVIDNVAPGNYTVVIDFIGYRKKSIANVGINGKTLSKDIGVVSLAKTTATLQGVVVTAQTKVIENKIDKMVFNAEKDLTSQGGVATDVLKKVPQISVDVDGNVELAGSTSIQFLINGKPSTAFGSSITDVLESIPASQIKSIEVITNPGARYDAEGLGGIINIILKTSTVKGINGNISLTAGTRQENGSVNINARTGDWGFHANVSGNARLKAETPSTSDRLSTDTGTNTSVLLHQQGTNQFIRHGVESNIGFDYTYKKKNSFSGSLNYDNFGNKSSGYINQLQTTTADGGLGAILSSIASLSNTYSTFNFHNIDASLNYKRTFDNEDQELEMSVNTSFGNNNGTAYNNQYAEPGDSLFYGTNSINPGKERETQAQIDYVQPLKKDVNWGMGGKFTARDITSSAGVTSFQPTPKSFLYDSTLSNSLDYHQKVYAVYSELSFPVGKLFDAKIGGRYERTDIDAFFSNAQQQTPPHGYNTFVPSIFFMKKITDDQTLKLNFSKRIERPDYRDLNPFINTNDPKNLSSGNPYLQPEIGYRFELSYSKDFDKAGTFMVTAFYRTSNHDIQPYIVYYDSLIVGNTVYHNVALSENQNIGLEKNVGMSIFSDLHINSKFNIRTNIFAFERHTINVIDPGYNSNSFNYRINMNFSYQFASTFAAEFFGNFNSARHEAQGIYPSFTSYSIALRKQFWDKKGSLALTANNAFAEYVSQKTAVFGPNFSTNAVRLVPFRSIGINFTWKFGKLQFKKEKEDQQDNGGQAAPEG